MELLGGLSPGVTCKLLFNHYVTTGSNVITSGIKGHGVRPNTHNTHLYMKLVSLVTVGQAANVSSLMEMTLMTEPTLELRPIGTGG